MTEYQEKHFYGNSSKISSKEGIAGNFDLLILACGWESRCLDIIKYDNENFNFDAVSIISFKLADKLGYDVKFMETLNSFIDKKKISSEIIYIENEVTDLKAIRNDIEDIISKIITELKRPLHIAFDITCCPRYVFLYLLAYCLRYDLTKNLTIFYSEADYKTDTMNYVHTRGHWKITEIPELEARSINLNKKLFIISAGWEGNRYRKLISKYEPDYLGILLPNPGFTIEYTEKSRRESEPLKEEYSLDDKSIVSAPAGDAIAAWAALEAPLLNRKDCHIAYLTFGPKPHALAMGIRGALHDEISVIYRIPDSYNKIEASGNGNFWRYDIINLIFF